MVILVLIDALSSSYLTEENMPFLYGLSQKGSYTRRIHASCGYCERTEIFTGMYPKQSNNFTAIGYMPKEAPYKKGVVLGGMSILEKISKKNTRRLFNIYSKITKKKMLGYYIPFQSLDKFALTEDALPHSQNNAFIGESIFSVLNDIDGKYTLELFTALGCHSFLTDDQRVARLKELLHHDYDFIPLYIGMADAVGHNNADKPNELKKCLKKIDNYLIEIFSAIDQMKSKTIHVMVLGDHGMEKVEEIVDFEQILSKMPLKKHKEYEYFLDSTIARFWCDDKNKSVIMNTINKEISDKGFFITDELTDKYNLSFGDSKVYGDLVWCANTGVLLFPDFFNKHAEKGMHGYAEPTDLGKGLCVTTYGDKKHNEANLVDICPTLCNMIGIRYPNNCKGISLI